MPGRAAKVVITEKQQVILREFAHSRTESAAISQRAKIILQAFEKVSNEEIAERVGLNRNQVGVWRKRWRDAWPDLTNFECHDAHQLRTAIRDLLSDAPRSGSPGTFTAEQITQILAVACEPPELSNLPITHWTHAELQAEVIRRGIVATISTTHIGTLLNAAALQPHRKKCGSTPLRKIPRPFSVRCSKFAKPISKLRSVMRQTAREPFASMK
jgi:putative transposase